MILDSEFIENAEGGKLDRVRDLLQSGANVNAKDNDGNTALLWASHHGHVEVVHAILNHKGVKVNATDERGDTALIYASRMGHLEVVRSLLQHDGVDLNITNEMGDTALIDASFHGHIEVVRALLSHDGVSVNIKNKDGWTALILAGKRGHSEVVRALERKKRNVEEVQMPREEGEWNRRADAKSKQAMEDKRRRQELYITNFARSGAVQQTTIDPARRNENIPSSDDAEFEPDRNKLLNVMNTPSAQPVELSVEFIERCIKKDYDGEQIKLGSGAFGDVFLAEDSRLPKKFAVKMIRPTHCDEETIKEIRKTFQTELSTLKRFRHPNIIVLYGFSLNVDSAQQCLVYEYASNGSLAGFFSDDGNRARLSAGNRLSIMFQLTRAVHFLHTGGCKVGGKGWNVFHRDIKSANICLADDFTPRLIDCGLAKFVPDDNANGSVALSTTGGPAWGTPGYMCPEYVTKKSRGLPRPYIAAYDVYSIGVVLVELILGCLNAGRSTRHDTQFLDVFDMYVKDERDRLIVDGWEKLMGDADPSIIWNTDALELVCKAAIQCMAPSPEERLNTKDLLDKLRDAILFNTNAAIQNQEAESAVGSGPCCVICNNYRADIQCSQGHVLCVTCIVDKLADDSGCQLLCLIKGCPSPPFQDEHLNGRIPVETYKRYKEKRTDSLV